MARPGPPAAGPAAFDARFRDGLAELFRLRRDVRRFRRDPLPAGAAERLLGLAGLAPSVGLSEPWRFATVDDADRRAAVRASFEACNAQALAARGDDAAAYARLRLAGLEEAPCQFAAFVDRATEQGRGLGRRTMPETLDYSVVMAIHTVWLAARAEGLGLGWVSILDPDRVAALLDVPPSWRLVGYFCLGYPEEASAVPELERAGWERRAAHPILRR